MLSRDMFKNFFFLTLTYRNLTLTYRNHQCKGHEVNQLLIVPDKDFKCEIPLCEQVCSGCRGLLEHLRQHRISDFFFIYCFKSTLTAFDVESQLQKTPCLVVVSKGKISFLCVYSQLCM